MPSIQNYGAVWYFPEILNYSVYLKCMVCFVGKEKVRMGSRTGLVNKVPSFQAMEYKMCKT